MKDVFWVRLPADAVTVMVLVPAGVVELLFPDPLLLLPPQPATTNPSPPIITIAHSNRLHLPRDRTNPPSPNKMMASSPSFPNGPWRSNREGA